LIYVLLHPHLTTTPGEGATRKQLLTGGNHLRQLKCIKMQEIFKSNTSHTRAVDDPTTIF
jgi:hypothetical protein